MLTSRYDEKGDPFGVFCSNPECPNSEKPEGHPIWSDDCILKDNVLVCPLCESPVIIPGTDES